MDNKDSADDSNDYVGLIRYAEGVKVAILLKEGDGTVKVSTRTRDGVSAQAICLSMGGGGHVAAAGAKVTGTMDEAQEKVLEASKQELLHKGFLQV
jgi:phosphoesterase RecJ-like protein